MCSPGKEGPHTMLGAPPRAPRQRKEDTLALLTTPAIRDVVMIDAQVERIVSAGDPHAADTIGEAYAAQADWDPRGTDGQVYVVLHPNRIQAWREADEIDGRTLMRDGAWLVCPIRPPAGPILFPPARPIEGDQS